MIVGIISVAAVVLALGCLGLLGGSLMRRLKALERQVAAAQEHVTTLADVLAQAPRTPS